MNDKPFAGTPAVPGAPVREGEPAFRDVVVDLWQNTEKLVRQEMALASAELDVKAQKLKTDVGAMAIGGAVLHAALLAFVAAVILLLANVMDAWLAALIVAVAAAGTGYLLIKKHQNISAKDVTPTRTIGSIQQDMQTFKEALK